jgi:trehalose-6-phosphate synthase
MMPEEEQERRMRSLRQQVADHNIYRWAGMLLSEAGKFAAARWWENTLPEGQSLEWEPDQLVEVG